ncbi:MAG TPA: hypothetical protein VGK14_10375 [Novimethylophilus sp.]|uniref:hypothetical protein n=1 Tax=Novimethylophilus sp. TaxID=2137426 RepID=UPI002F3FF9E3
MLTPRKSATITRACSATPLLDTHIALWVAAATETLPMHHADPFDRMLVAQAVTEPLKLLTHDSTVAKYGDVIVLV